MAVRGCGRGHMVARRVLYLSHDIYSSLPIMM
jgi:hypothetical protein